LERREGVHGQRVVPLPGLGRKWIFAAGRTRKGASNYNSVFSDIVSLFNMICSLMKLIFVRYITVKLLLHIKFSVNPAGTKDLK